MMAMTADGKIAKNSDHKANWTSKADKEIFVQKTKEAGVIIMGLKTYQTIGHPLSERLNIVMSRPDELAESIPDALEYSSQPPVDILEDLAKRDFKEVVLGGGTTINSLFLRENLIDELWLTIEPKLFGSGLSLFTEIDVDLNLKLIDFSRIGTDSVLLKYKIIK